MGNINRVVEFAERSANETFEAELTVVTPEQKLEIMKLLLILGSEMVELAKAISAAGNIPEHLAKLTNDLIIQTHSTISSNIGSILKIKQKGKQST